MDINDLVQYYWINGEGSSFYLSPDTTNERYLVEVDGLGLSAVERFTTKRPYDHGDARRGARYVARAIDLVLAFRASSGVALWSAMGDWADAFNLEHGPGTLKVVLPDDDATERRIDAEVSDRISLGSRDRKGARVQLVAVALTADDPLLYNPAQQSESANFNGATPVDITCTNDGDAKTWPTIEIASGVESPVLTHVETGWTLSLDYTVPAGKTVIIDAEEGMVELDDGTSLESKLAVTDRFFQLLTGEDVVRISATSGTSLCTVKWYERYVALHV